MGHPHFLRHVSVFQGKTFWEELIAYYPSMRRRHHRKRRFQQFLVAAGKALSRRYVTTMGGYTGTSTESPSILHRLHRKVRVQKYFYVY